MERRLTRAELRVGNVDDRFEDPIVRWSVERAVACHRLEGAAGKPRGARRAR